MTWKIVGYEVLFLFNLFILFSFIWAMTDSTARRLEKGFMVCVRIYFQTRNEFLNALVKSSSVEETTTKGLSN